MEELILEIISLTTYRDISYYTRHLILPLWRHFGGMEWSGTQNYLKGIVEDTRRLIEKSSLSQGFILQYIANDKDNPSYFFVAQAILVYATPVDIDFIQRYNIASKQQSLPDNIHIDDEILACALVCYVLDGYGYSQWNINIIVPEEKFDYPINDYCLSRVKHVEFYQNGFVFDNKYYLYNRFIDKKPVNAGDSIPAVFKMLKDNVDITKADFLLRLDERLAIDVDKADIKQIEFMEKFYGPSFQFSKSKLAKAKNITIHYDAETLNKLLMVIKKDYDNDLAEEFWHVEIEQLPNILETYEREYVITTFIHGKYYPSRKSFRHIDFIKNQYPTEIFRQKHCGALNTGIAVDYYTETKNEHYKIWCVENIDMSEELWYKLTLISLNTQYRILFNEMLEKI